MAQIIKEITVDVAKRNLFQAIVAKQHDTNSRFLKVTLENEGVKITVETSSVVVINAKRADGSAAAFAGSVNEDGSVTVPLTPWMLELDDLVKCDISVVDSESRKLTSTSFELEVETAAYGDDEITEDENYDLLVSLLSSVADVTGECQTATQAANVAIANAEDATTAALAASQEAQGVASHLPMISANGYWMLWDTETESYVESTYYARGENGGADGLYINPDDGLLYLTQNGSLLGEGIALPDSGTGFDAITFDEGGYLHIQLEGEDVVEPVYIGTGGGGSDYGSTLRVANKLPSKKFTVMNTAEEVPIIVEITSTDSVDGSPTGDVTAEWTVNGTRVAIESVEQGEYSWDAKPYLVEGTTNEIKLYVEDAYGNNRTTTYTVSVSVYGITWNLADMANHESSSVNVRLIATGSGTKKVVVALDGVTIAEKSVTIDGGTVMVTVNPQSHGAHTITAYMETTVDGETVKTDMLRHTGIWLASGNYTPVVAVYNPAISTTQFATTLVQYMVVTPGIETSSVQLMEGNKVVSELTVDRAIQTWSYKATAVGTVELSIVSGDSSEDITLTVASIGYEIAPITEGLVFDINPEGHANTETNRGEFGYTDGSGVNHPFTFSDNFDWVNGGFQLDADGVTAFVVKRGCYVEADRSLFNDNAKEDGKHIEMIFKSTMVRDTTADIISCMSGGIGLRMTAEHATLSSELKNCVTPYCTDEKIEMCYNIEAESEAKLATVYLKAAPSRALEYTSDDRWAQSSPAKLRIGSEEADVWIYRIKMYGNALTRREVLANYIADCADVSEMVARYERNDIFNSDGSIDMTKLRQRNTKLRVIHIKGDKMTTSKDDDGEVTVDVEMWYTDGGEEHHFIATGVTMKAQGTSSLEYIAAALNLDLDFSDATSWVNGKGEAITTYAFSDKSIGVNYFNLKADVASCEKANNVVNVERYHRFNPFVFKGKAADPRIRDTIEGHPCAVFFTNTSNATITVGDRTLAPNATMLYFAGNMNNSKKNFAVFGQDNTAYPDQCCVEVMNNNDAECRFKTPIDNSGNWKDLFEFRFPKNPTASMIARFHELQNWIVSTDTTAATGDSLGRTVTYGEKDSLGNEITYTTDSAAYRRAKFIHEVGNYFHTDSLDFHYLYTEFTCGVDNRAKNTFISYEPDANGVWKWCYRNHYDHDTAYGNDNSGGLTFEYGLEDTDVVGDAYAFNASDSVLWCNVRDFRSAELAAMFKNREAVNCWDADQILAEFREYQSARPEALEMEDAHNKYINTVAERYRSMMLGTKEYQRFYFIPKQAAYMASKYRSSLCTENKITLRTNVTEGSTAKGDIYGVVPSIKMYLRCQFGNMGEFVVRANAGQAYTMECPDGSVLNDLETYIFTSKWISEVGSLAHLRPKFVDFSNAPLLRRAEIGSADSTLVNTTMNTANTGGINFDNNPLLEYIDLRNIPYLAQPLDLSNLASLEELYTTNSGITGVTFAKGAPLRIAALNSPKQLVALQLDKIESFTMGGGALTSIRVEGSPAIDTLKLIKAATALERGRLLDVTWADSNPDAILMLTTKAGLDEFGKDAEVFVLTGTAAVTQAAQSDIDTIRATFPDLEVSCSEYLESFTVTFVDYDGTVLNTQTVRQYGAAVNPITAGFISTPTRESTVDTVFTYIGWDVSFNYILGNTTVTARYSEAVRTYTVNWWRDTAHTELIATISGVEAYSGVDYPGDPLVSDTGAIWMGWDDLTTSVVSDMDVHAVFVSPVMPDTVASGYDFLYSDDPQDNSGYTLAEFYGIISTGNAKSYFKVGDKVKIVPSTTAFKDKEITLAVYGFNHYKLADGSGEFAPVVFGMIGLMNANYQMNSSNTNVGGWDASKMRTYLNETVFPALPVQWQAMIKKVQVLASEGDTYPTILTSEDNLFLFANAEVGFNTTAVPYCNEVDPDAEEMTFSIFTDNNSRIKKTYNGTGSAASWWLRSPYASYSTNFMTVYTSGTSGSSHAGGSYGVSFGFCV